MAGSGPVADKTTRGMTKSTLLAASDGVVTEYAFYGGMITVGVDASGQIKRHFVGAGSFKQDEPIFVAPQPTALRIVRRGQLPIGFVLAQNSNEFFGIAIIQDFEATV